ncbi:MAG: tetratricopeptide repeat protein [Candidatus Hodarchaeales archaeon]|jgi:tetratricopeptide (TPR) repeat protein
MNVPKSTPRDLRYVENLRRQGKLQEALKVIKDIEKKETLTPGDQLSLLISKGKIYTVLQLYPESAKIGELAYRLSRGFGRVPDMIMALIFRANMAILGEFEESLEYLREAEDLLNSLGDASLSFITRQKANILYRKGLAHWVKTDVKEALEEALECLALQEKLGRKTDIGYTLQLLGNIHLSIKKLDLADDYLSRALRIFEELEDPIGGAWILSVLGRVSFNKGDLNNALAYSKKSLSTKSISVILKHSNYATLGDVYYMKGELDRAIRYYRRVSSLAEKRNNYSSMLNFKMVIGQIYVAKGEYELAIEILESGLKLAKEVNLIYPIISSLLGLILVYYQMDLKDELKDRLDQLKEYVEKRDTELIGTRMGLNGYRLGKALLLKKSGRSHNRAEAEKLLKQVVQEAPNPLIQQKAISELCEFYLEELHLFNEPEVLEEINPLIEQLLKYAKEQNLYGSLAEARLLQAKLALIQMNFEDAQQLLTQAQRIAELYGLNYLAQRISSEHDNYLDKISEWKNLKEKDAPMAERLELASVDSVIERLQGKSAIEPTELVEEEPIVLLIMDKSGISYFSYVFIEDWDSDWLFSSFMSAFETFSSALFSESIDRIRIGENIILVNPIESFLVCYVIKGQSYLLIFGQT